MALQATCKPICFMWWFQLVAHQMSCKEHLPDSSPNYIHEVCVCVCVRAISDLSFV